MLQTPCSRTGQDWIGNQGRALTDGAKVGHGWRGSPQERRSTGWGTAQDGVPAEALQTNGDPFHRQHNNLRAARLVRQLSGGQGGNGEKAGKPKQKPQICWGDTPVGVLIPCHAMPCYAMLCLPTK